MKTYVGITIGPITNALQYARDPQSLWFACAIFSEISREICEALTAPNCPFENVKIYTPYYFHGMKVDDGVAKTHDRIVFSGENVDSVILEKIIRLVKNDICDLFPIEYQIPEYKRFLTGYFQIHYICLEENENLNKNCMMEIYPYLHDMEQIVPEHTDTNQNPFYDLFGLREDVRSQRIMSSPLAHTVKKGANQFFNARGEFKTVYEIANPKEPDGRKRVPYYCLVRCNGDDIDHLLRSYSENRKLISFSSGCLEHSIMACEMIRRFGGLTVYAGGDEFFFFAPLIGCDGSSVFELCQRIEQKFYSIMKEHLPWSNSPSLSFGVSIQRCTHEVYEAFTKTGELLKLAKMLSLKNNTAVRITNKKRMENIICNNEDIDAFLDIFKEGYDVTEGLVRGEQKRAQMQEALDIILEFQDIVISVAETAKNGNLSPEEYLRSVSKIFDGKTMERNPMFLKNLLLLYYKKLVRKERQIWTLRKSQDEFDVKKTYAYDYEEQSIFVFEEILKMKENLLELEQERSPFFS